MTAAKSLAEEVERCRRTARDCEIVLTKAMGVPLAPHDAAEARQA